jgi:hypothetical protein
MNRRMLAKSPWYGAAALLLCAGAAGAQQGAAVMPSQQESPSASSIRAANPARSTLVLPSSPSHPVLEIPGRDPNPALSLPLPSPFVGCWEGTIKGFDSLIPIGVFSTYATGTNITYRFCYTPNSDGSSYRMELRKLVIDNKELTPTGFVNQGVGRYPAWERVFAQSSVRHPDFMATIHSGPSAGGLLRRGDCYSPEPEPGRNARRRVDEAQWQGLPQSRFPRGFQPRS